MQFKDIVGQEPIKARLIQTVNDERINHAQMFYGPPGSGKLPLAIAYAQYINCQNRSKTDSCGTCPSCKKYQKLIHPDLHFVFPVFKDKNNKPISDHFIQKWREINLETPYFTFNQWLDKIASENKQASIYRDEAQEIIRKLSLKTYESEFKVMIIWLPEKMNITAANKLLKMIEEPPPKTVFILISENRGTVLPTIMSRTSPVRVPPIAEEDMSKYLVDTFSAEPGDALVISRLSRGNLAEARNHFNMSRTRSENLEILNNWMIALVKKDVRACLKWTDEMSTKGRERQKSFLTFSLHFFRELLMYRTKKPQLNYLLESEKAFIEKVAKAINLKYIQQINDEIESAYFHIERNGMGKIILLDLSFKLIRLIQK
ncbi:MAG: DNA polymerase III subunit [Bacteroidota bacterium]|nr:DNA polymerase III subunit [Bacteroidota bacterium]